MAKFIGAEAEQQLRTGLRNLIRPVRFVYFTSPVARGACREQPALLEELATLSEKLIRGVRQLVADNAEANRYGIDKLSATFFGSQVDITHRASRRRS